MAINKSWDDDTPTLRRFISAWMGYCIACRRPIMWNIKHWRLPFLNWRNPFCSKIKLKSYVYMGDTNCCSLHIINLLYWVHPNWYTHSIKSVSSTTTTTTIDKCAVVDKCEVMHIGHNNIQHNYTVANQQLIATDRQQDLGITITRHLKWQKQTKKSCKTPEY